MNKDFTTFDYAISSVLTRAPWDFEVTFETHVEPTIAGYLPKLSRIIGSVSRLVARQVGAPPELPAIWGYFLLYRTEESTITVNAFVDTRFWMDSRDLEVALIRSNVHSISADGWRLPALQHNTLSVEPIPLNREWFDYIDDPDAVVGAFGKSLVRYV